MAYNTARVYTETDSKMSVGCVDAAPDQVLN